MIAPELLAELFAINYRVIRRQVDGLTHEDSLLQLPFRGNCLNWVLGHIVATRNRALALLGEPPIWSEAEAARYATAPNRSPATQMHSRWKRSCATWTARRSG
jgi:hypothetical protein